MNIVTKLIVLLSLFALVQKSAFGQKKRVIGLQKTSCYGACPVFSLDIFSNCKVILKAEKFMDLGEGTFSSKVSKSQLGELKAQFEKANYFSLNDRYHAKATDLPTTYFYFANENESKRIEVYGDWPEKLEEVDQRLNKLISQLSWKKAKTKK